MSRNLSARLTWGLLLILFGFYLASGSIVLTAAAGSMLFGFAFVIHALVRIIIAHESAEKGSSP